MNKRLISIATIISLSSFNTLADGWTEWHTISNYDVHFDGNIYVKLNENINESNNCTSTNNVAISKSASNYEAALSSIITAVTANKEMRFYLGEINSGAKCISDVSYSRAIGFR